MKKTKCIHFFKMNIVYVILRHYIDERRVEKG